MPIHEKVAVLRRERGLTATDVAQLMNVEVEQYKAWETGLGNVPGGIYGLATLAELLGVEMRSLLDGADEYATDALAVLWPLWGPQESSRAALVALDEWLRWDDRLTAQATPADVPVDCLARRGVPEALLGIAGEYTLPSLSMPAFPEWDFVAARQIARELAEAVAPLWNVSSGDGFDPWSVADDFGIPVGHVPMGGGNYTATVRVGHGYLIAVNSDLALTQRRRALTHALLHIAFGHVTNGCLAPIADEDDDSIYSCSGVSVDLCSAVDGVEHALLHPKQVALDDAGNTASTRRPFSPPTPVRADGESAPYWEQHDVRVLRPSLRRELGLANSALLLAGAGETTWPASLARRWVKVVSRGFVDNVDVVRRFPFGELGCPSVEDVETALWRGRIVRAQLDAHNNARLL